MGKVHALDAFIKGSDDVSLTNIWKRVFLLGNMLNIVHDKLDIILSVELEVMHISRMFIGALESFQVEHLFPVRMQYLGKLVIKALTKSAREG